jgi:predicted dehydrogenase
MTQKNYRVAVIGHTGRGDYGHGLDVVWKAFPNVEVVALADANEAGRAKAATKLGVKNAYADYEEMLDKEKPQLVSVAARHLDQHRDMVVACARAGASVFLEKPMCRTLAEADEMVKACEAHHVKLAIAHQTRHSPRVAAIQELIKEGKVGTVLELRGRGKDDQRGGGNDLMVLGTHVMDLMRVFVGDARWCHSAIWVKGKPATKDQVAPGGEAMGPVLGDQIHATFGFDRGVVGTFGTSRTETAGERGRFGLQIHGTKGVIALTTGSLPAAFYSPDPAWGLSGKPGWQPITSSGLGRPEPVQAKGLDSGNEWIVKDLLEAIEKDRQPKGSVYDGRAALEMILSVYESYRLKGPVELPLKNRQHPLSLL